MRRGNTRWWRRVAFACSLTIVASVALAAVAVAAADTTPPRSVATPERPPDHNGWYRTDIVEVTLEVRDDESGIYTVEAYDNDRPFWSAFGFSPPKKTWTTTLEICCSNVHTIRYRATDAAGNVEQWRQLIVRTDARAPLVDLYPSATGPSYMLPWTSGNWTVRHTCDDPTYNSGLISSGCAGDSKLWIDGVARNPEVMHTISAEGRHWAKGTEHDVAGNLGQDSADLYIDRGAPIATVAMRAVAVAGPDGVVLFGSAPDPLLADGTPGSGALLAWFRVRDPDTEEEAGFSPATHVAGDLWTATVDVPPGRYTVEFWAHDRAVNIGYSPRVEVVVLGNELIAIPPLPAPLPSLDDVRSVVDRFVRTPSGSNTSGTSYNRETVWPWSGFSRSDSGETNEGRG